MVESAVKLEVQERKTQLSNDPDGELNTVNTDDENEEIEYEAWKLRELKRYELHIFDRELTKCAVLGISMLLLLLAGQNGIFSNMPFFVMF